MARPLPPGIDRLPSGRIRIRWADSTGRRRSETLDTKDVRLAARIRAKHIEDAHRASAGLGDEVHQRQRLSVLLPRYLESLAADASPRHQKDVRSGVRLAIGRLGDPKAAELTRGRIEQLARELAGEGRSHRTANKLVGYVVTMLGWAEATGTIARSPVKTWTRLRESGAHQSKRRARLSPDDARKLMAAADAYDRRDAGKHRHHPVVGDLVALALGTGMRLQEMLSLTWEDFTREGVRVRAEKAKTDTERVVPLTEELAQRLTSRRQRRALEAGALPPQSERIMLGPRSRTPLDTPSGARRAYAWLRRCIDDAGLEHRSASGRTLDWHALRHSVASWLAQSGQPPQAIRAILGHADISTTMRVYTELADAPARDAIDSLPTMLDVSTDEPETETGA